MRAWAALVILGCSNGASTPPDGSLPDDGGTRADITNDSSSTADASDAGDPDGATCEASLVDPQNCGRCGHDCLGGTCDAGTCMPFTVVSEPATGVTSDNAFVYWTQAAQGRVAKCPRVGCPGGSSLVVGAAAPTGIGVDSTNVYFTTSIADAGALSACATGGCDGGPSVLASGLSFPSRLVLDSNAIFFDVGDSDIFACTLPSCGNGAASIAQTMMSTGLAEEWNILYWTEGRSSIWSCQKGNCQTTRKLIASNLASLGAVAAYGGTVFAVRTGATGDILRCPNSPGCTPVVIAQNVADPTEIATDWTGIYFLLRTSGKLAYCPLGGCVGAPRILIDAIAGPNAVALDQDAVFVAGDSAVMGVAKP